MSPGISRKVSPKKALEKESRPKPEVVVFEDNSDDVHDEETRAKGKVSYIFVRHDNLS